MHDESSREKGGAMLRVSIDRIHGTSPITIIESLDAFPVLHKRKSRPKAAFSMTQQAA
jgi:hypothetical protein